MTRSRGKAPSQRQLRVGEEIRHALAWTLERSDFEDPALHSPVTVTEVRCSPDLRNCTAFVTPLGGGDPEPVLKALRKVAPHLRHELARQVRLKYVPQLSFQPDESFDEAQHIDALLRSPEVRRDLAAEGEPDDDDFEDDDLEDAEAETATDQDGAEDDREPAADAEADADAKADAGGRHGA